MKIEVSAEDFINELALQIEEYKELQKRKRQIEYEFNLYKTFCFCCKLKENELESLNKFMQYCDERNIILL